MKRFVLTILTAAFCSLTAVAEPTTPAPAFLPLVQTDTYTLASEHVFPYELWVLARNIRLDGRAGDDVFLLAGATRPGFSTTNSGSIAVNGWTGGSCWAAGMNVELNGNVERHARLAAQVVRVNGRIGGNFMTAAVTVSLDTNATVGGSARILADYFILRGTVEGNLQVSARKVVLDGVVNGSADIRAETISVLSKTRIRDTLTCESSEPVRPDGEAVIGGGVLTRAPENNMALSFTGTLLSFIGATLVGMFFILFSPRMLVRSVCWMEAAPWRSLLTGLGVLLVIPFAIYFSFASLLGIPLSLVTAGLYGLGVYLGRFVAALSIARLLTGSRRRQPLPIPSAPLMALGLALFYLAFFLPAFLADAIWFWFTVSGLGGLFLSVRGMPAMPFPATPPFRQPVPDAKPDHPPN